MSIKESPFPKALNIIRPSTPLIQLQEYSNSSSTASSSTISTLSNFSSTSNNVRVPPTIINPSNFAYFQNNLPSFKSTTNPVGVNPHRFLQRPRSNSNLSKSTFFSSLSISSYGGSDEEEEDEEEEAMNEEDELDSIDGLTDDDEEEMTTKIVAKIKHGTIMNGKGEFVNKGIAAVTEDQNSWLDEARANRKIADLEIEKASLLVLNSTLEAKLRQQTLQIVELQKRLQMNEGPLTPISDKHVEMDELFDDHTTVINNSEEEGEEEDIENDQVFQRIKLMLEGLILQAEVALLEKSKQSGKVLSPQEYYNNYFPIRDEEKQHNVEETLHKLTAVRSLSPNIMQPRRNQNRRVSDTSSILSYSSSSSSSSSSLQSNPSSTKMSRNLSRQSSPPVMVTSPRPSSPRYLSQLRKSQDFEKPKWH